MFLQRYQKQSTCRAKTAKRYSVFHDSFADCAKVMLGSIKFQFLLDRSFFTGYLNG
jgi:hypothetical protein